MKTDFLHQLQRNPLQNEGMEERLWDYIDGLSSTAEKSFIEELLATQEAWREKYKELLETHQLMQTAIELDEPSMRFTQNVMEEITRLQIAPATKNYIDKRIIYGIAAFFIVMLGGLLVYTLGSVNWAASEPSSTGKMINDYTSKFDWSKMFNNTYTTLFMIVNAVLGLMLLDMYLNKKKKALHEKQV